MTDLLRRGSEWLQRMRSRHCTSPVYYEHDGQISSVNASYGRTEYELATESGLTVGSHACDFLILAEELGFEPEPSESIPGP